MLPLIAGISGDSFYDPAAMADGFRVAMIVSAALSATGGAVAWLTISDDVLVAEPGLRDETPVRASTDFSCAVAGTPLAPTSEAARAPSVSK